MPPPPATARPPPGPRGQATVELALTLPVVLVALLLVVQVGLVLRAQLLVADAAREAARAAAVGAEGPAPAGLDPARTTVRTTNAPTSGFVTVEVEHRFATDVPIVGPLVPDVDLRARVTMRRE